MFDRWKLWLAVRWLGHQRVPAVHRRWLRAKDNGFREWIRSEYHGFRWRYAVIRQAELIPWRDLLNRPAGGEAYCGGVLFKDPARQPTLHHFRGQRDIDTPLLAEQAAAVNPVVVPGRFFWCGPLAFHFGHQIADFGSRVLVASLDPREGELLWYPWRVSEQFDDLLPWQHFLLSYLNPGRKRHLIATNAMRVRELVVVPQQARMHAAPTLAHLEAMNWCEKALTPQRGGLVYVSRAKFAPCRSAETLLGAYAGEVLLEQFLHERGITVIHPEMLSLKEQLEIYLGAESLIIAEGSAQHGLELLGFHRSKPLVVICRRPQGDGMDLPLRSRFPSVRFIDALQEQWKAVDGVAWNGLSLLHWPSVADAINPLISVQLSSRECAALQQASEDQLQQLAVAVPLERVPSAMLP